MTCTWWIMLSVNWSSWKNVGLILHLHADYLLLHFWTDHFFFSAIKFFSQLKWVCFSCLDHLDLAGLRIFNSWWRNPFLWIEVVGGILGTSDICRLMEKSLPVKGVSWWNFGNVVHLQIGNVIELQIFLLCPHSWIHMHRALFCSNNENTECFSKKWLGFAACVWFALSKWVYTLSAHYFDAAWLVHISRRRSALVVVGTFQNYSMLAPFYKTAPTMTNLKNVT